MAGIDNITSEILDDARKKAEAGRSVAEKKAETILGNAREESERIREASAAKAAKDADSYARRIESQAGMRKRQSILAVKQEVIGEVIEAAYEKLADLPDDEYFALLLKLLEKNAQSGRGELLLSEKDRRRMPSSFAEEAEKAVSAAGGTVTVSSTPADIANGFVLRYGGVEENCTLRALFAEKRDALRDRAQAVLWQ